MPSSSATAPACWPAWTSRSSASGSLSQRRAHGIWVTGGEQLPVGLKLPLVFRVQLIELKEHGNLRLRPRDVDRQPALLVPDDWSRALLVPEKPRELHEERPLHDSRAVVRDLPPRRNFFSLIHNGTMLRIGHGLLPDRHRNGRDRGGLFPKRESISDAQPLAPSIGRRLLSGEPVGPVVDDQGGFHATHRGDFGRRPGQQPQRPEGPPPAADTSVADWGHMVR